MKTLITYMAHTDRIDIKEVEVTKDFNIHDTVIYIPNGLCFRVENNKQLRLMKESGNYFKLDSGD